MMQFDFNAAFNAAGYLAFIVGGLLYARSKVPNQTIGNYKALAESQEKRIKALEDQTLIYQANHIENVKALADLQGQIKVYKELPLQEMATAMEKISNTNQLILDTLNKSAELLANEPPLSIGKVTTTTRVSN